MFPPAADVRSDILVVGPRLDGAMNRFCAMIVEDIAALEASGTHMVEALVVEARRGREGPAIPPACVALPLPCRPPSRRRAFFVFVLFVCWCWCCRCARMDCSAAGEVSRQGQGGGEGARCKGQPGGGRCGREGSAVGARRHQGMRAVSLSLSLSLSRTLSLRIRASPTRHTAVKRKRGSAESCDCTAFHSSL